MDSWSRPVQGVGASFRRTPRRPAAHRRDPFLSPLARGPRVMELRTGHRDRSRGVVPPIAAGRRRSAGSSILRCRRAALKRGEDSGRAGFCAPLLAHRHATGTPAFRPLSGTSRTLIIPRADYFVAAARHRQARPTSHASSASIRAIVQADPQTEPFQSRRRCSGTPQQPQALRGLAANLGIRELKISRFSNRDGHIMQTVLVTGAAGGNRAATGATAQRRLSQLG